MKPVPVDKNSIILTDLNNIEQDFSKLLTIKDSITYINCSNINVNIETTINKIILKKCNNIKLEVNKIISGIDIVNCKNIEFVTTKNKPIYNLYIENSENLNIKINKKNFKETNIDICDCLDILFYDFNDKTILKL